MRSTLRLGLAVLLCALLSACSSPPPQKPRPQATEARRDQVKALANDPRASDTQVIEGVLRQACKGKPDIQVQSMTTGLGEQRYTVEYTSELPYTETAADQRKMGTDAEAAAFRIQSANQKAMGQVLEATLSTLLDRKVDGMTMTLTFHGEVVQIFELDMEAACQAASGVHPGDPVKAAALLKSTESHWERYTVR